MRKAAAMVVVLAVLMLASPRPAAAADPALSVPEAELDAALTCPATFQAAGREPVLLVHGTGATPEENWGWNYASVLPQQGWDVCTVRLPNRSLGDIQVTSEYVVHAVRTIAERSGRKVVVLGHSQGGLQPRWAVRWWEAARAAVDDLITLAAPNHGTAAADAACVAGCFPSAHQMKQGSAFITALNSGDETPGEVSYTSIYSLTDELVQPAAPAPTAALAGASNILLQDLCPGRPGEHALLAADAVVYAMVTDAFLQPGPADPARFDPATCLRTSFDGVSAGPLLDLTFENRRFPDFQPSATEPPLAPYAAPAAPPAPTPQPAVQPVTSTTASTAGSVGAPAAPAPAPQPELPRTGGGDAVLVLSAVLSVAGAGGIALRRRL
jgi:hypothetical protein